MGSVKFNSERQMYGCGWLAATLFFVGGLMLGEPIEGNMIIFGIIFLIGLVVIYFSISKPR